MTQGAADQPREDIEDRIEKLKQQVRELANGRMMEGVADDCPADMEEQFWQYVLAFESAPRVQPFELLVQSGFSLPPPDELDDAALTAKLLEVIDGLALMRIYLDSTDHLSDRELYVRLWRDVLREPTELLPDRLEAAEHVDLVGSGSEEDVQLYLRYYADEDERRFWAQDFPDFRVPDLEDPPFDRDRLLPRPCHGKPVRPDS